MRIPVIDSVDLLVVGGHTGACAAAIAAADRGLKVLMAVGSPYLGEDAAAHMRYEDPQLSPVSPVARRLYRRLWGAGTPTPTVLKEGLEREVIHAGVRLLYGMHPAGMLHDEQGLAAGACLASRSGLLAVRAHKVIDATLHHSAGPQG